MIEGPRWIEREALVQLHERSLSRYGGAGGIRDRGLLDSALMRPQNKFLYEPETTLFDLAAAYCFGLAKNHPFFDGNKRAALAAVGLFLELNGVRLEADPVELEQVVLSVVTDALDEKGFADWLVRHSVTDW